MPDWQIDEVGPDNVVAIDGVPRGAAAQMLPLPLVAPMTGPFEIHVKAHRLLPADAKVPSPCPPTTAGQLAAHNGGQGLSRRQRRNHTRRARPPPGCCGNRRPLPRGESGGDTRTRCSIPSYAPKAPFAAELLGHRKKITASLASSVTIDPTARPRRTEVRLYDRLRTGRPTSSWRSPRELAEERPLGRTTKTRTKSKSWPASC